MKISEFAKRSGVTVKTLRYYDKIGLLKPSEKTEAGYRLYCDEDFIKLQQITTLKFIGLSLEEIKQVIDEKGENIESIIDIQTRALEENKRHIDTVLIALNKAKKQIKNNNFLEISKLIDIIKITNMETRAKHRFNNASEKYVTDSYYWRSKSAKLINELVNPNNNDVIIDLGCGTGNQIIELSQEINLGIGIDISEGMIMQAKENMKNRNVEPNKHPKNNNPQNKENIKSKREQNIEFYIGTFEELDLNVNLNEKGITKIISNYAMHHLTTAYKQKAIEKMIAIGGESLERIVIGDLMFFENPEGYEKEFSVVGYSPEVDFPSSIEELMKCFSKFNFNIEVYKLHPLVGVILADRNKI